MIQLNQQAFFWKEFDSNHKPIAAKECQIVFSPETGGKISFLADLDNEFNYEEQKNEIIPIIYAQSIDGKKITLVNAKFVRAKFQFVANLELTLLEYSVEYIFNGGWIDIDQPIGVIHIRYSYLELWFNQMEIKHPQDIKDKTIASVMIHKEHLEGSSNDYKVLFNINNGFSENFFNNRSITYEATNSLAMAKKDNFAINEAIELAQVVKSFFEIVTFYSKNRTFIEEFYITHKRKLKDGVEVDEIVHLLFKQDDYEDEKKMSHLEFLFRYEDIKESFVRILNNWIENHDKNRNEYSAFCNVIADKNTKFNIYSHYFQLVSAMEGYYRQNNDEELEFRKEINQLIKQSGIKILLPLNNRIHTSIAHCIYNMRNDIAHAKTSIQINDRVKSSYEYLKLVALLIMLKDISLDYAKISKNILDMDLKYIERQLIEAFGVQR